MYLVVFVQETALLEVCSKHYCCNSLKKKSRKFQCLLMGMEIVLFSRIVLYILGSYFLKNKNNKIVCI